MSIVAHSVETPHKSKNFFLYYINLNGKRGNHAIEAFPFLSTTDLPLLTNNLCMHISIYLHNPFGRKSLKTFLLEVTNTLLKPASITFQNKMPHVWMETTQRHDVLQRFYSQ